ncbi:MAG: hypothetical protein U9P79_08080, partial [Candidatus Cloacimonadota bacterium]|nr:hypothetical protein [Candidatus Cloacimonadota bacterium]
KRTEIYKTDHILRSVYIDSAGEHEVVFEFNPEAFVKNYRLSFYAHIFAFLCFVVAAIITILKNGKRKMENGKWKTENGKWKTENGKRKMGKGRRENG